MNQTINELIKALKSTRKNKGYSQRAFSKIAGMPQSRLSRIESGKIDLRTSNLLELARTLDLELILIPRHSVPAVKSLIRSLDSREVTEGDKALYDLDNWEDDD